MSSKYYLLIKKKDIYISDKNDSPQDYDFENACPNCGSGRIRKKLSLNGIPKEPIEYTVFTDVLISEQFLFHLIGEGIHLPKLVEINGEDGSLNYFVLNGSWTLSPMDIKKSKGIVTENQCDFCSRNGFFDELYNERKYYFNKEDFNISNTNIFNTWEHFGASVMNPKGNRIFVVARPRMIVDNKFVEATLSYGANMNVEFEECIFLND